MKEPITLESVDDHLKEKELKHGDKVYFEALDKDYGRAEFTICPIWKYRKLKRVFIYPKQQRDVKYYYRIECGYSKQISIQSWMHKGMKEPWIWLHFWCLDHKTQSFYVYVPPNSKSFSIQILTAFCINFDNE